MKLRLLDLMGGADYIRFVTTELHFDLTRVEREISLADTAIREKLSRTYLIQRSDPPFKSTA